MEIEGEKDGAGVDSPTYKTREKSGASFLAVELYEFGRRYGFLNKAENRVHSCQVKSIHSLTHNARLFCGEQSTELH